MPFNSKLISGLLIVSLAYIQGSYGQASGMASLPGIKQGVEIAAVSSDGMSRYLARDGPIQPAITAIGGLPMRAAEQINRGISRISDGLDSTAKSMSRAAGNEGSIRMPGMAQVRNMMPGPVSQMGGLMGQAIAAKNRAIMGQARRGIESGQRMMGMMEGKLQATRMVSADDDNNKSQQEDVPMQPEAEESKIEEDKISDEDKNNGAKGRDWHYDDDEDFYDDGYGPNSMDFHYEDDDSAYIRPWQYQSHRVRPWTLWRSNTQQ